jgi:DNA replication protein DnaC
MDTEAKVCKYCHNKEDDASFSGKIASTNVCSECESQFIERWNRIINKNGVEYEHFTFDLFHINKDNQKQVKVCKDFASTESDRNGLLLSSPDPGNGKTHLAVATLRQWVSLNYEPIIYERDKIQRAPFRIVSEPQLLLEVRSTFRADSTDDEADIINKYTSTKILLIDDVGKYNPQDLSFLQRVMFAIVGQLYVQHKHLIMTSNKNGAELQAYLGDYTFDRICGMTNNKITAITGDSYRRR